MRGEAYVSENNIQQAIADYDEAIKIDPNYAGAYIDRALAYAYKDTIDRAKTDQNSPAAFINIGADKLNKANYDKAILDCNKAVELAPKYVNSYITRARIYMLGNDFDKVWTDVHKIEELGGKLSSEWLEGLKKASGREK